MAKIQNLSELSQSFSFTEYDFFDFYRRSFEHTELGRMKKHLPLREIAESFGLVSNRRAPQKRAEAVLHPGREGGADVPEDVHADELPETHEATGRGRPTETSARRTASRPPLSNAAAHRRPPKRKTL